MRVFLLIALILSSANTFACGTTAQSFKGYWLKDSISSKQQMLARRGCSEPINYAPFIADPVIAKVLDDAIKSNIDSSIIIKVLKKYNCVHGARKTEWYPIISAFIEHHASENVCDIEKISRMYIVISEGGANLRSEPSSSSSKLNTVREGRPVLVNKVNNNWAHVGSYAGDGYIYLPLLKKY